MFPEYQCWNPIGDSLVYSGKTPATFLMAVEITTAILPVKRHYNRIFTVEKPLIFQLISASVAERPFMSANIPTQLQSLTVDKKVVQSAKLIKKKMILSQSALQLIFQLRLVFFNFICFITRKSRPQLHAKLLLNLRTKPQWYLNH